MISYRFSAVAVIVVLAAWLLVPPSWVVTDFQGSGYDFAQTNPCSILEQVPTGSAKWTFIGFIFLLFLTLAYGLFNKAVSRPMAALGLLISGTLIYYQSPLLGQCRSTGGMIGFLITATLVGLLYLHHLFGPRQARPLPAIPYGSP